jgi:hypothetical protein
LSGLGLDRAARRFRGAVTAPPRPPMPPPPEDPDPLPVRRARPLAVAHDGEQASLF